MLKITAISILVLFLASVLVFPASLSYAQTSNLTAGNPSFQTTGQAGMNYGNHNGSMNYGNNTGFGHHYGMNGTGMMMPPGMNRTGMMSATGMNQTGMMSSGTTTPQMPTSTAVSPTMTKIMPPLEQVKSGVAPKNVQCKPGLILLLKAEDGSAACVDPTVSQILLQRGW